MCLSQREVRNAASDGSSRHGLAGTEHDDPSHLELLTKFGLTVALLASGAAVVLIAPPAGDDGVGMVVWGAMVCLLLLGAVLGAALRQHYEIAFRLAMATGLVVVGILVLRGASLG